MRFLCKETQYSIIRNNRKYFKNPILNKVGYKRNRYNYEAQNITITK